MLDAIRERTLGTEVDDHRSSTGELRLVAGVLEQAIEDARKGSQDARAWLASDVEACNADGLTFRFACLFLGVDPSWMRSVALEYIAAHPFVPRSRAKRRSPISEAA